MKKSLKIILIIVGIIVSIILLDTLQARILKHSPIISWKKELADGDSWVDRGILVDTYYCTREQDIQTISWKFKGNKFTCPISDPNNSEKKGEQVIQFDLELPHHILIDDEKYDDSMVRSQEKINISGIKFESIDYKKLKNYEKQYSPLINYIKNKCNDFDINKWSISVNLFSNDNNGVINLKYLIQDNIETNKSITFNITNNVIDTVYFSNIDFDVDESKLIDYIKEFEKTHNQKKKKFDNGEEFISEEVKYSYFYNLDKLIYTYQLYFYETVDGEKIINNNYISEYIINENYPLMEL